MPHSASSSLSRPCGMWQAHGWCQRQAVRHQAQGSSAYAWCSKDGGRQVFEVSACALKKTQRTRAAMLQSQQGITLSCARRRASSKRGGSAAIRWPSALSKRPRCTSTWRTCNNTPQHPPAVHDNLDKTCRTCTSTSFFWSYPDALLHTGSCSCRNLTACRCSCGAPVSAKRRSCIMYSPGSRWEAAMTM